MWATGTSGSDGVERRAPGFRVVAYPSARGCAATYFPGADVLVPLDSTAAGCNTPTTKSIVVRLAPAGGEPAPTPATAGG